MTAPSGWCLGLAGGKITDSGFGEVRGFVASVPFPSPISRVLDSRISAGQTVFRGKLVGTKPHRENRGPYG